MVDPYLLRPTRLVGEVLGNGGLPDNIFEFLPVWFISTRGDMVGLSMELRTGQGFHAFLGNFASGVKPIPGFAVLNLIYFNRCVVVYLLHWLFSVPAGQYSTTWRLSS